MKISLIAAMAKNNVIGKNNQLPWNLPADLTYFKNKTMGKPILMGRKTYDSIGRPLPGRRNIVISRQPHLIIPGCEVFASIDDALKAAQQAEEVMVIGGAHIYDQVITKANRLYITTIDADISGDAFFPQWDLTQWTMISAEKHVPDEKNKYGYCFQVWECL